MVRAHQGAGVIGRAGAAGGLRALLQARPEIRPARAHAARTHLRCQDNPVDCLIVDHQDCVTRWRGRRPLRRAGCGIRRYG
jgi:hypothetical protein